MPRSLLANLLVLVLLSRYGSAEEQPSLTSCNNEDGQCEESTVNLLQYTLAVEDGESQVEPPMIQIEADHQLGPPRIQYERFGVPITIFLQTHMNAIALRQHAARQHLSVTDHSADHIEFLLWFDGQVWDQSALDAFVADVNSSAEVDFEGHPGKGGMPLVEINCTQQRIDEILQKYNGTRGGILFVESDQTIDPIPEVPENESAGLAEIDASSRGIPWGLDRIDDASGRDGSYSPPSTGAGVHVYVLDTGVRTTHTDFGGRAIPTLESVNTGFKVCQSWDTRCASDHHGHGTHCASTVGGSKFGVAPKAILHAVKVLNPSGATSLIVQAIDWVVTNKPTSTAVISMSIQGGGQAQSYKAAIDVAVSDGVTVVVAAGNYNVDANRYSPAFVPSALTIGSTDYLDRRSSFSNYGSRIDLFAPGSDIQAASHQNDRDDTTMSGTSMACPHVSGAVALLLETNSHMQPSAVRSALLSAAVSVVTGKTSATTDKFLQVGSLTSSERRRRRRRRRRRDSPTA